MRTIQEDFREYAYLDRKRTTSAGISAREYRRWLVLHDRLEDIFSQGTCQPRNSERRVSLRVPTRLRVTYDTEDLEGTVTNLSRTGCYVATGLPAPVGTHLTLLLQIAATGEPVELPSEVVWTLLNRGGKIHERGMGLRFLDVTPEDRKRLDDLYDGLSPDV